MVDVVKTCRIHVMGASGAGVTTMGRALADTLAIPHHDTDDYYWQPTTPPYRIKRAVTDRVRLMREMFLGRSDWVLSGALESWSAPIVSLFDMVIFLRVPTNLRLERLRNREARRFGDDAVSPEGWRHQETEEFLEWASHYDDGTREGRSLERHEVWLDTLTCPVLRLDGAQTTQYLVSQTIDALG